MDEATPAEGNDPEAPPTTENPADGAQAVDPQAESAGADESQAVVGDESSVVEDKTG